MWFSVMLYIVALQKITVLVGERVVTVLYAGNIDIFLIIQIWRVFVAINLILAIAAFPIIVILAPFSRTNLKTLEQTTLKNLRFLFFVK